MFATLTTAGVLAHAGGPWVAGFGWLFFLVPLFWIALIVLLVALFRRRGHHPGWAHGYAGHPGWGNAARSAESTLAERFAQGDIDEKEYRARLEVLRANNPVPPTK